MIRTFVASLQERPKRLYPVRVRLSLDVFAERVLHTVVPVRKTLVSLGLVGVDGGIRIRVLADKAVQRLSVGALDYFGADFVAVTVFQPNDRSLA